MKTYHDTEWGVPVHDDRRMFEHLMMEAMQCGLSWSLMIKKREIFRACFDGFDYDRIAAYTGEDIERILHTEGMIRSRRKIEAVIGNARCFRKIREEYGSFCDWLWAHTDGKTVLYMGHEKGPIPVSNGLSDQIARELKAYGFRYLGTVTVYSHLQACGIVNDHRRDCPCRQAINAQNPTVRKRRYLERIS
ncbi:MAG: DNA-3-methyladenine glycosylase I [Clostridia bacterium]|nr:DNA-3-methyladenine glycosylase I [Clostridia bacterium]